METKINKSTPIIDFGGGVENRYDTKANWNNVNPILDRGIIVIEEDSDGTIRLKAGNGSSDYKNLKYVSL